LKDRQPAIPRDRTSDASITIWQGYHHAWEYNHRLNRFGSYVRSHQKDGQQETVAGHTAASGTGGDTAHFSEFVTRVHATGIAFQEGWGETTIECMRAVTTPFRIKVDDLTLTPGLVGKETYAVTINGFDLYAKRHADKLISFDLEITDPTVYANGTKMRFNILGSVCFDCRTAECQLWPLALEMEDVGRRRRSPAAEGPRPPAAPAAHTRERGIRYYPVIEQVVSWLKRQIARFTDLETVKRGVLGLDQDRLRRRLFRLFGRQFFLRLLKWRIVTPYVLHVNYVIVGGDRDALRVTESPLFENSYTWDTKTELHREEAGVLSIAVRGEAPEVYDVNTVAFRQISLETRLDQEFGTSNPIQWGKGMHLLEWDMAIREIRVVAGGVTAQLDLFYKSWSEAMNEVITLTTWGALRSAGSADLSARVLLLQFKEATSSEQLKLPGEIHWPGGGLNAQDHPSACFERPATGERRALADE
jgi:hypothetical protein